VQTSENIEAMQHALKGARFGTPWGRHESLILIHQRTFSFEVCKVQVHSFMDDTLRESDCPDLIKALRNRYEDASTPARFTMAYVKFGRSVQKVDFLHDTPANGSESRNDCDVRLRLSEE